tara:strand:+ start:482 stop:1501 length:1020 start_codon:yes stop_codon:yes gene_type:complete
MAKGTVDIRDAFFDEIAKFGKEDKDVVILSDDMDVFSLMEFKKNFPKQFINVGVAEQNMINVAAGLASTGKKVFVFGIAPFVTYRCYEQIKFNICSMSLPITIIGMGSGFGFSHDGPTHHAVHDIAAMMALPNIIIHNPCDENYARDAARSSYHNYEDPTYVRLDKGVLPTIRSTRDDRGNGFRMVKSGQEVLFISTGKFVSLAKKLSNNLKNLQLDIMDGHGRIDKMSYKQDSAVVDVYRFRPFGDLYLSMLMREEKFKHVIVIEENVENGGLGSIIKDLILEFGLPCTFSHFSVENEHCFVYGKRDFIHKEYALDYDSLKSMVVVDLQHHKLLGNYG